MRSIGATRNKSCMCRSINETFTWIGAILVNVAFISITCYGAVTLWPLGFILCGAYTLILFQMARFNEPDADDHRYEAVAEDDTVVRQEATTTQSSRQVSFLCNILYALAVLGIGATGSFLPINILSCEYNPSPSPSPPHSYPEWVTNYTDLPEGVRAWAQNSGKPNQRTSFAYVEGTDTVLFSGRADSTDLYEYLFESRPGEAPVRFNDYQSPTLFTNVNGQTACFLSDYMYQNILRCYISGEYVLVEDSVDPDSHQPRNIFFENLFAYNDTLWYKTHKFEPVSKGANIKSFNVITKELKSYSHLVVPNSTDPDTDGGDKSSGYCNYEKESRRISLGVVFAAGLPMFVASIALWKRKGIPSMGLTTLLSLYCIFAATGASMVNQVVADAWPTFFSSVGTIFLCEMTIRYLVLDAKGCRWCLNTAGIFFIIGLVGLIYHPSVFDGRDDHLSEWMLFDLLCLVPLLLFGMANKSLFLVLLVGLGWIANAFRLTAHFNQTLDYNVTFLIDFIIFILFGSLIGALGLLLSNYQDPFHEYVKSTLVWLSSREQDAVEELATNSDLSEELLPNDDDARV